MWEARQRERNGGDGAVVEAVVLKRCMVGEVWWFDA